jgi:hypothetical protein
MTVMEEKLRSGELFGGFIVLVSQTSPGQKLPAVILHHKLFM